MKHDQIMFKACNSTSAKANGISTGEKNDSNRSLTKTCLNQRGLGNSPTKDAQSPGPSGFW